MLAYLFRDTGALPRTGGVLDQPCDIMVGIMLALQSINKKEDAEREKRESKMKQMQRKTKGR